MEKEKHKKNKDETKKNEKKQKQQKDKKDKEKNKTTDDELFEELFDGPEEVILPLLLLPFLWQPPMFDTLCLIPSV